MNWVAHVYVPICITRLCFSLVVVCNFGLSAMLMGAVTRKQELK